MLQQRAAYPIHMGHKLPLSALLSQALVAFVIEFDNEFEHRTPHRTTNHGSRAESRSAPWLVSMAMWVKFLRFVPDNGITVREFQNLAALPNKEAKMWLIRLSRWWGYITIDKRAAEDPFNWLIRPTSAGKKALQVWRPLTGVIETRWRERFGKGTVDKLCQSMLSLVSQFNPELPDYLSILGYEMLSTGPHPERSDGAKRGTPLASKYTLPLLLSKVLLAFAIQYERNSHLSLAISANVLRVARDEGTPIRDLPRSSGVSKEAIAMAVKRLEEGALAIVQAGAEGSRVKALILTAEGRQARDTYYQTVWAIEKDWEAVFGHPVVALRSSLEDMAGESLPGQSRLFAGLQPYPDGWRAFVPRREVLPHYPMILHRGGFPDGS